MNKTFMAACVGLVLLGGCAHTDRSPANTSLTVPAQWRHDLAQGGVPGERSSAQALTPSAAWWRRFNDEGLNHWIEQALQRNNDLATAAVRVQRARLEAGLAAGDQLPTVSASGAVSRSRALDHGGATTKAASAAVSVSWEVDLWGRLASQHNAAEWAAQASEEDRQAVALSVAGTTATLYWELAYLNQRLQASQQSLDYAARTLALVEAQYRAGAADGLDLAQAQQTLAAQQAAHTQLLQQRVQTRNALALLLQAPPGEAGPEPASLPQGDLPSVDVGLPASLLTRRPDLRAAEARLRQSRALVDATRAAYFPALTLTGSAGGTSTALSDVLRNPVGTLGVGLVLPFVQWREMERTVAVSRADESLAILSFRQAWYQALSDVDNALSARQQYEAQARQLEAALAAARRAEQLSEVRYRAGAVPLKTWLDAQESRRTAENNLAQNRLNRLDNLVVLHQALGGSAVPPTAAP